MSLETPPVAGYKLGMNSRSLGACLLICMGLWAAMPVQASLKSEFESLLAEESLAGVVWSVVDAAGTRTGAAGLAHSGSGTALAEDSRIEVGSVAKTLLALAVLRRVSSSTLGLDQPVAELLPELPIDNPWQHTHPLRLRHLLDMTSGLEDIRLWHFFSRQHRADMPLAEAVTRDPSVLRLRFAPGTRFAYSNLGYTVAAMVLERHTGERYERWAERELLQPLGLVRSSFSPPAPTTGPAGQAAVAWGHLERGEPVPTAELAVRPAARFSTSAADMARLAQFLMGDGRLAGQPFIAEPLLRAMGRPQSTDAARAGLQTGYALGLFTRDRHGAVGLCHGGSVAGFRAMFCVYPAEQKAFFVAHNADVEAARYGRFDERLVRELRLNQPPAPALPGPPPAADAAWAGLYVPDPSRLQQLRWPERVLGFWRLSIDEQGATLRQGLAPPRRLHRIGDGLYRQDDRQQATLVLLRGPTGEPMLGGGHITLRQTHVLEPLGLALVAAGGVWSLAWWLLVPAWRAWRGRGAPWREPAAWGAAGVLIAGLALAVQPWQQLGDLSPASAALAGASLLFPLTLLAQAWRLHRQAAAVRRLADGLALGAGLVFCGVLAAFDLWPALLWRL